MMPGHLVAEYWTEVKQLLIEQHKLSERDAQRGIDDSRERLASHGVGDLIYHRNPGHVAGTIAGALRGGGFREPEFPTASSA
jgi:hypothetical protein